MMGGARAEKRVVMEMVATKGVAATVSEGVVRAAAVAVRGGVEVGRVAVAVEWGEL